MSTYHVTMHRSATLSDEERRRRLHQAYLFILSLRPKKTDDQEQPEERVPPMASDAWAEELNLQAQAELDVS